MVLTDAPGSTRVARVLLLGVLGILLARSSPHAQRQLSWDTLEVTARLGADGVLDVTELQTMVFAGDWNGGERTFNLRPRQRLDLVGVERVEPGGQRVALREDRSLDDVDEYAMTDARTLRWRSRLPSDPPFAGTRITYAIHYRLSRILRLDGERYVLDHDFAFPDRVGAIARFTLQLDLDPAWRPLTAIAQRYDAGPLPPGRSYVLTVPLQFTGTGTPSANAGRPPPEIVRAVQAIFALLIVSIGWLVVRERRFGRFEPVSADAVNREWVREHLLSHPAEVVGAAWDETVGPDEVVALLARLQSEGTIACEVLPLGKGDVLALELKADRTSLDGYERALVDGLFFDGRTKTTTEAVQNHYKEKGFSPAEVIATGLKARAQAILPPGDAPRVWPWLSLAFFAAGTGSLIQEWVSNGAGGSAPGIVLFVAVMLAVIGQITGHLFRRRIDWGYLALAVLLLVPVTVGAAVAWLLWTRVGAGDPDWSVLMVAGVTLVTLWVVNTSVNALKSRQHPGAIAFRKRLAAARAYFARELTKDEPALRDDWYPWIAALGLAKDADRWSVAHGRDTDRAGWHTSSSSSGPSGSHSGDAPFGGFGAGRSGGAGATGSFAAAAAGLAAGVASPSSSSSGDGGSSSGGSSGGGGGGGW